MSEEREILLVQSKLKSYVKSKGFNCSAAVVKALSDQMYGVIDAALEETARQKQKTLLEKHL